MNKGTTFERQVQRVLEDMGFQAQLTKQTGDGGIDIIATSRDPFVSGKYVVQCKNWTKPVGEPELRDLYGVVHAEQANKGILITTSSFTEPARRFAEGKQLELIDGAQFSRLSERTTGDKGSASFEDRRQSLLEYLEDNPKNVKALKELADSYISVEQHGYPFDYASALKYYNRIVELGESSSDPKSVTRYVEALNGKAICHVGEGDLISAHKCLVAATPKVHRGSTLWGVLMSNLGRIYHYVEMFDEATSTYESLRASLPSSVAKELTEDLFDLAMMESQPEENIGLYEYCDEKESRQLFCFPDPVGRIRGSWAAHSPQTFADLVNAWYRLASGVCNDTDCEENTIYYVAFDYDWYKTQCQEVARGLTRRRSLLMATVPDYCAEYISITRSVIDTDMSIVETISRDLECLGKEGYSTTDDGTPRFLRDTMVSVVNQNNSLNIIKAAIDERQRLCERQESMRAQTLELARDDLKRLKAEWRQGIAAQLLQRDSVDRQITARAQSPSQNQNEHEASKDPAEPPLGIFGTLFRWGKRK